MKSRDLARAPRNIPRPSKDRRGRDSGKSTTLVTGILRTTPIGPLREGAPVGAVLVAVGYKLAQR